MKYIKAYEDIEEDDFNVELKYYEGLIEDVHTEPQPNEYIVGKITGIIDLPNMPQNIIDLILYVNKHIGQMIEYKPDDKGYNYKVKWEIPEDIKNTFNSEKYKNIDKNEIGNFSLRKDQILFHSNNIEDAQQYIQQNKFNL